MGRCVDGNIPEKFYGKNLETFSLWQGDKIDDKRTSKLDGDIFEDIPDTFYQWQEDEIDDKITSKFHIDEKIAGTFSARRSALSLWKEGGKCNCQPWSWQGGKL